MGLFEMPPATEWFKQAAQEYKLDIVLRHSDPELYRRVADAMHYLPVAYDPPMLDYQMAYLVGSGWDVEDCSLAILHDNKPAALCPLVIATKSKVWAMNSGGTGILGPLFARGLSYKRKKTISQKLYKVINALARQRGVQSWLGEDLFNNEIGLDSWHDELMLQGAELSVNHGSYVDLSLDLPAIRSRFRESYKSLINQGERLWDVYLLTDGSHEDVWRKFEALHLAVAGRKTRSEQSWNVQWQTIIEGRAFLVCLLDREQNMVGGGYFHTTAHEGLYAVAAYDRYLFDKPLGHVVQNQAITEMKRRGLLWYKIGARLYITDLPEPTDKELSISHFKHGFSTHMIPAYRTKNYVT